MNIRHIYAVAALDLKNTSRDKTAIFFLLVFPVSFYVFFATFFGALDSVESSVKYYNSNTPQFSSTLLFMIAFLNVAPTVALAREMGFLNRLMVTPVRVYELWFGFCLRAMVLFAIGYTVVMVAGFILFGLYPTQNPLQLALPILVTAFAVLPAGILIGVFFRRFQSAFNAGMFFLQPMLIFSGAGISQESFPAWAKTLAQFVPSFYAVQIAQLGWDGEFFTRASVFPVTVLVVFGLCCAFLAAMLFRNSFR